MAAVWFLLLTTLLVTKAYGKYKIDGRIVGGQPTTIEEYPHQVSLIYIDSHYCGGSIVNSFYIVTAAHCTDGISASDIFVRAGSTMVNEGGQYKQVAQIFQHQSFDKDTYDYDISVLRLTSGLNFGSGVAPISLPPESSDDVESDLLGTATGWGRLSTNGILPMELQKVDLPTIGADICDLIYGNSVTVRMFCAGYVEGMKDTCQGDSGGPYVYNGVLLGVTSWGDGCGASNSPGVYTKVSYFTSYINGIINKVYGKLNGPHTRIVGGTPTTIEESPYTVSVIYIDSHYCGGSLVHPQYIVTAAHCTDGYLAEWLLVRAGSTYVNQHGEVRQVSVINQHINFSLETLENDISVLKVASPFDINQSIQTISLPLQDIPVDENIFGIVTGWGRLSDGGFLPLELQQVTLPTMNQQRCTSHYVGVKVTNRMFCAGYWEGGQDTCQGDSGGPFVTNGVLVGVTSWGDGCASPNSPGVYTKVSSFADFINNIITN